MITIKSLNIFVSTSPFLVLPRRLYMYQSILFGESQGWGPVSSAGVWGAAAPHA